MVRFSVDLEVRPDCADDHVAVLDTVGTRYRLSISTRIKRDLLALLVESGRVSLEVVAISHGDVSSESESTNSVKRSA
jgi:hypothetical protein